MNPSLNVHVTGRRIVATLIDGLVFSILSAIISNVFNLDLPTSDIDLTQLDVGGSGILLVLALAYYLLMEGFLGRTVGKMVTGIRVVNEDGGRPDFVSVLVRTLLRLIDGLIGYLVGLIIVVNSSRRRRLGDMAAKTLVVRN
ncbi:RDD family protein [Winogradskya consettensis]|uniref:RDD family protein n=1 Tax=Winogradskya consettensis TaxID=113560 RepID=UPI001BB39F54|nr:RDD family protein [Actinoplanes consettensis]